MKLLLKVFFTAIFVFSFSGCLSHFFIETETRLQIENALAESKIFSLSVVSENNKTEHAWINETLEPGEKSSVETGDWVGKFTIKIRYGISEKEMQSFEKKIEFEGGSTYMVIESVKDSIKVRFK